MRSSARGAGVLLVGAAAVALWAAPSRAQVPMERAFELEQQGLIPEAAAAYRGALLAEPANLAALLGAERTYSQIGRRDTVVALARRALAADSANRTAHLVLLRTLHAVRADAEATAAFERWVAVLPRDAGAYRERVRLFLADGREVEARALVQRARARLADPAALAPELAQVELREGNAVRAAEEWRTAVSRDAGQREQAVLSLQAVVPGGRDAVLRTLAGGAAASVGRDLAAGLLLAWNEPRRAWTTMRQEATETGRRRAVALRRFAEAAARLEGREAQHVAAEALEAAAAELPAEEGARTLVESARAYAAAGDGAAARRLLRAIADAAESGPAVALAARATLIDLAAGEGDAAGAERLLAAERGNLPARERLRLGRRVALAWIRAGELERAAAAAAGDSSLAGDEVRGWVALYRGELGVAAALFRRVGADAGDQGRAPDRAAAVALVTAVGRDTLAALGAALLAAERGDTLGAARALAAEGRRLDGDGRAVVLLRASRLAAAGRDTAAAEILWREIVEGSPTSTASAAALLDLARVAAARGRLATAAEHLEALILRYPNSALVPEARRELDRVRGLVPRS